MSKRGQRFTQEEKLTIIAEGEKTDAKIVCAKYDISDETYRRWRYKAQGIKPRKHFSLKKKLKILEEGVRDGVYRTCAAHHIDPRTYYSWKRRIGFTKSPKAGRPNRFSEEEELAILAEGYENGILGTCAAYGISFTTYYNWKRRSG